MQYTQQYTTHSIGGTYSLRLSTTALLYLYTYTIGRQRPINLQPGLSPPLNPSLQQRIHPPLPAPLHTPLINRHLPHPPHDILIHIPIPHPQRAAQTCIRRVPGIRQPNRLGQQLLQQLIYQKSDAVELEAVEVGLAPAVTLNE